MPAPFATFLLMYVMCWDQFSLQSMITHRYLVSVTSIFFPSINVPFMDRGTHFGVKRMKFVLLTFRENWLALTHTYVLAISLLISETISFRLYPVAKRFLSSAKRIGMKYSETWGKSLIYNKKSKVPMEDSWGTPHLIVLRSDSHPQ